MVMVWLPIFLGHEVLQRKLLENDHILLRNYRKMTMSFSNNSFLKLSHYNIIDL